jgi:hypothetical protein
MRPSISVAIAGLLCFIGYVSAQPKMRMTVILAALLTLASPATAKDPKDRM